MNSFHLDLLSNECFKFFMYYCMSVKVTLLTDVYKANLLLLNEHFHSSLQLQLITMFYAGMSLHLGL